MISYLTIGTIIIIVGILGTFFSAQIKEMSNQNNTPEVNHTNPIEPKKDRTIVTYKGSQYDVTDFIIHHPGGKRAIMNNNGKDVEQLMLDNQHSKNAYDILAKYKIN